MVKKDENVRTVYRSTAKKTLVKLCQLQLNVAWDLLINK